jgi:hypothetical protein
MSKKNRKAARGSIQKRVENAKKRAMDKREVPSGSHASVGHKLDDVMQTVTLIKGAKTFGIPNDGLKDFLDDFNGKSEKQSDDLINRDPGKVLAARAERMYADRELFDREMQAEHYISDAKGRELWELGNVDKVNALKAADENLAVAESKLEAKEAAAAKTNKWIGACAGVIILTLIVLFVATMFNRTSPEYQLANSPQAKYSTAITYQYNDIAAAAKIAEMQKAIAAGTVKSGL